MYNFLLTTNDSPDASDMALQYDRKLFNRLPREIIATIFIFSLPRDHSEDNKGLRIIQQIELPKLLSVCRRWYNVAQGTPQLWSCICLGGTVMSHHVASRLRRDAQGLQHFVKRSGALKLDIRLDYENIVTRLTASIADIGKLSERIQRLDLAFHSKVGPRNIEAIMRFSFPVLETLNIHCYSFDDVQIVLPQFPALKHLCLRGAGLYIRSGSSSTPSPQTQLRQVPPMIGRPITYTLKSLKLIDCASPRELDRMSDYRSPLHVVDLAIQFDLVRGYRDLEGEDLFASKQIFESAFHLPSVKSLKIIDVEGHNATRLLSILTLPCLQRLDLGGCTSASQGDLQSAMVNLVLLSGNPSLRMVNIGDTWYAVGGEVFPTRLIDARMDEDGVSR